MVKYNCMNSILKKLVVLFSSIFSVFSFNCCSNYSSYSLKKDENINFFLCFSDGFSNKTDILNYGSTYKILVNTSLGSALLNSKIHFSFLGVESYFLSSVYNHNYASDFQMYHLTLLSGEENVWIKINYDNYSSIKQYSVYSNSINSTVLFKSQEKCLVDTCSYIFTTFEEYTNFSSNELKRTFVELDTSYFANHSLLFISLPFWNYDYYYSYLDTFVFDTYIHVQFNYVVSDLDPFYDWHSSNFIFLISIEIQQISNCCVDIFRRLPNELNQN